MTLGEEHEFEAVVWGDTVKLQGYSILGCTPTSQFHSFVCIRMFVPIHCSLGLYPEESIIQSQLTKPCIVLPQYHP